MSTKPSVWLVLCLVACGDSPDEGPATLTSVCGEGHALLELVSSTEPLEKERWCAEATYPCDGDATCGVADGRYQRLRGDVVTREGGFTHGQPSGTWTEWHDAQTRAMTYGFLNGMADGDFAAWRADGSKLWERHFVAGRACGIWKTYSEQATHEVDHGPCDDTPVPLPDTWGLTSPRVTDFGWDGATCPSGTRDETVDGDVVTTRCLPSGPYRRSRGDHVLEIGTLVDGARDGAWTTFFPREHGAQRVATTGRYDTGRRAGTWHFYRVDGTLERRGPFVADREDGPWEGYAPSLLRAWSGAYEDGKKHGTWRTFHDLGSPIAHAVVGGALSTEETWVDGVRHGPFSHWFPSGNKEREGRYENGAWSGVVTTHWEHGGPRYATTYVGGMASGPHEAWDEAGRLEAKGRFQFGARVGTWLGWVEPNPLILFFGGGGARTRFEATFVDGLAQGPMTQHYAPDDTLGPLAGEGTLRDGVDEGDFTLYWPSGQTLVEGLFEGGAAQGPWQSFYPSGAERATWPFARGLLHGPFIEHHENGQPYRVGQYAYDRRIGTWTTYDTSGAVLRVEECGADGSGCLCAIAPEGCR